MGSSPMMHTYNSTVTLYSITTMIVTVCDDLVVLETIASKMTTLVQQDKTAVSSSAVSLSLDYMQSDREIHYL